MYISLHVNINAIMTNKLQKNTAKETFETMYGDIVTEE